MIKLEGVYPAMTELIIQPKFIGRPGIGHSPVHTDVVSGNAFFKFHRIRDGNNRLYQPVERIIADHRFAFFITANRLQFGIGSDHGLH